MAIPAAGPAGALARLLATSENLWFFTWMGPTMRYERIRNLSEQDKSLASPELEGLRTVWRERKQSIAARGSLDSFLTKLKREWAIETGIIERLYHWDRGVTEVLIQQGIDAAVIAHRAGTSETKALHIKDLIDDQESTIDALFAFVKEETSRS